MVVRRMTWPKYQEFLFTSELRLISNFITKTDSFLTQEWDEMQKQIHEEADGMDEEEAQMTWNSYSSEFFELNVHFPELHASMAFVSLYSLLEHHLTTLCHKRQRECKFAVSVDDLKDRGIDACKTYMTKVCGLKFPAHTAEWARIKDHQRVRNIIVHRRGELRKTGDEKVRKFIEKSKTAKLLWETEIALSYAFCVDFIRTLEKFARQVTVAIPTTKTV